MVGGSRDTHHLGSHPENFFQMAENLSLFGWSIPEARDVAGRPEHEPSDENRMKIMLLLSLGETNKDIAAALGISQPTLRRHYFQLLSTRRIARKQLDATVWVKLYEKVLAGDVSAIKEFNKKLDKHDVAELSANFGGKAERKPAAPKKEPALGKKEIARLEAVNAADGTDWGDDLLVPGKYDA